MSYFFRLTRNILAVMGLILVIIVMILGVGYWQLTKTPALAKGMCSVDLNEDQVTMYASEFDAKVDAFETEWQAAEVGAPVTISLTEDEANAKIQKWIENTDLPVDISDVKLNFTVDDQCNEKILLFGKVDVACTKLPTGVEMQITTDKNGKPEITISDLAIGSGFVIPQPVEDRIAKAIPVDGFLTYLFKNAKVDLTDINISDGVLTFTANKE